MRKRHVRPAGAARNRPDARHRSVIGTEFEARIVEHVNFAGRPAVVTEIAGSAHRTGSHEFVLEPDDPLGEGFLLRLGDVAKRC